MNSPIIKDNINNSISDADQPRGVDFDEQTEFCFTDIDISDFLKNEVKKAFEKIPEETQGDDEPKLEENDRNQERDETDTSVAEENADTICEGVSYEDADAIFEQMAKEIFGKVRGSAAEKTEKASVPDAGHCVQIGYEANVCYHCGGSFIERGGRMVCESCGTFRPKAITTEETALLYSAFQKIRLAAFADAEKEFDDVIHRYPGCAQAYWGRLMAKYEIKHEKNKNGERVPICYAPSIGNVSESSDYKKALEYADEENAAVFRNQVEHIERIREEWQKKASKEKPYDVFICFDEGGPAERADGEDLRDLYFTLKKKGYRVFFSGESLRDKEEELREAYVYAAIASAKMMLVYGSSPEYFHSAWMRNDWMRYQKRMQAGEKHSESLIVAYKGFSPKDLPGALSSASKQYIDAGQKLFDENLIKTVNLMIELADGIKLNAEGKVICQHHAITVPAKAPTCTKPGWTESSYCSICGAMIKPHEVLPPTGHSFSNWKVVRPVGCVEEGIFERVCAGGEKETMRKPSRGGHRISDEWTTVVEASEGKEGLRARKCIDCGAHVEEVIIPALPASGLRYSQGLSYRINGDGESCQIIGKGSCSDTEIVIPPSIDGYTVTGIAKEAFKENEKLTGVILSDTVVSIGDYAFYKCPSLTNVRFGDALASIGAYAFYRCLSLESVRMGESLRSIGVYAFYECVSLKSLVLPDSVETVEGQAFSLCENLSALVLGESIVSIGIAAFRGCKHLSYVHIPASVERIGTGAFPNSIISFRISSVNSKYTVIDGCLLSKDEKTFVQYASGKTEDSFSLPETVTVIADEAFRDSGSLRSLTIPAGVVAIGKAAFRNCRNLTSISYGGKKKNWNKLNLHNEWRTGSHILSVSCVGGSIKLK